MAEEKQNTISDAVSEQHAADLKLSGSTISQQHKPAPDNEQQTDEEAITFKPKSKQDHCQLNAQKEVNLPPNGKGLDEKEDFLHQIRAKSFTLRRTVTAKPTFTSVPATNDKVSAILEKANAIRQALLQGLPEYWTAGGALRNVPVGAGRRKTKPPGRGGLGGFPEGCLYDGSGDMHQIELDSEMLVEEWHVAAHGGFRHVFPVKRRRSSSGCQTC
ncbi:hypothetical protein GH714_003545 [Hevea brasiliensis]|uniref:Dof-type domain-containing protein n=1 Tax=Hevea brasiliensis TaxID=3981 RepID=A0A6A6LYI8_HEVBR|nr:hypothetical protein GH714_003545 [Hevea brasiliensis]